ncbi:MAG: TfoX/Sxy family protein [Pseudohongiellaceae bacterium]|nr:TfoX/Sxy family protein [Pseudohongiellaceae bacterium]
MSEFTQYLIEAFELLGPVYSRPMFGGHGIYHDGLMFGLVVDDTLYLKSDAEIAHYFEAEDLSMFTYTKQGKPVKIAYYQAPDAVLEDREEALVWARRSWQAALKADKKKAKKARPYNN